MFELVFRLVLGAVGGQKRCCVARFFCLGLRALVFVKGVGRLGFLVITLALLVNVSFASYLGSSSKRCSSVCNVILIGGCVKLLSFRSTTNGACRPAPTSIARFRTGSDLGVSSSQVKVVLKGDVRPRAGRGSGAAGFALGGFRPVSFTGTIMSVATRDLIISTPRATPIVALGLRGKSIRPFLCGGSVLMAPVT